MAAAAPAPLLLTCALGIERLALRGALGRAVVLRTGAGAPAARQAVAGVLRAEADPGRTAVLATGFCGGLAPGMRPGDLVVAEETADLTDATAGAGGARTRCSGTELLAGVLAATLRGRHAVHTGVLAGTGRIVRGEERRTLRQRTGAIAADMESAAVLRTATGTSVGRPVAAVRVVVDAPRHELIRIQTLKGGISAFCVLRSLMPAFSEWHNAALLPRR